MSDMNPESDMFRYSADAAPQGGPDAMDARQPKSPEEQLQMVAYSPENYASIEIQTNPENARHFTRMYAGETLRMFHYVEQSPPWFFAESIRKLHERRHALQISIPLGRMSPTRSDIFAGLVGGNHWVEIDVNDRLNGQTQEVDDKEILFHGDQEIGEYQEFRGKPHIKKEVSHLEAAEKREVLAETMEQSALELAALMALILKVEEQDTFGSDDEKYSVDLFLRLGKARLDTKHFPELLNMPETHEGFRPLGEKITEAFGVLRDIARGEAVIEYEQQDGAMARRVLPNLYAMPRNNGMLNLAYDYISDRLGHTTQDPSEVVPDMLNEVRRLRAEGNTEAAMEIEEEIVNIEATRRLEDYDNATAAITAYILMDNWDFDAYYAYGVGGRRGLSDLQELSPREVEYINSDIGFNDKAKLIYPMHRLRKEYRGKPGSERGTRREFPRKAGLLPALDALPILSSHALDLISVETIATRSLNYPSREDNEVLAQLAAMTDVRAAVLHRRILDNGRQIQRRDGDDRLNIDHVRRAQSDMQLDGLGLTEQTKRQMVDELRNSGYLIPEDAEIETVNDLFEATQRKLINVTVEQKVYGNKRNGESNVRIEGETWEFERSYLGDRKIWDNIQVIEDGFTGEFSSVNLHELQEEEAAEVLREAGEKVLQVALGAQTNAIDIPVGLQGFYAYTAIFSKFKETDYERLVQGVMTGDTLRSMNKGMNSAIQMLGRAYELDRDTARALETYLRIAFIGSVSAVVSREVGRGSKPSSTTDMEGKAQIPYDSSVGYQEDTPKAIQNAALTVAFVPTKLKNNGELDWASEEHEQLYNIIVNNRRVPTPKEVKDMNLGLFNEKHIEQMKGMFPLIDMSV